MLRSISLGGQAEGETRASMSADRNSRDQA